MASSIFIFIINHQKFRSKHKSTSISMSLYFPSLCGQVALQLKAYTLLLQLNIFPDFWKVQSQIRGPRAVVEDLLVVSSRMVFGVHFPSFLNKNLALYSLINKERKGVRVKQTIETLPNPSKTCDSRALIPPFQSHLPHLSNKQSQYNSVMFMCQLPSGKHQFPIILLIEPQSMESSYNDQSSCSSDSQVRIKKHSESNQEGKWAVGQWTDQEKIRYISYIHFNKDSLSSKLLRRTSKIFKQMSMFIQSRSPAQCRSQNQKVHRRFKTINRIVTSFKTEIGAERFDAAYEELSKHPLIKFHTEFEHKSSSQAEAERQARKETREMSVQTSSEGVVVEMTIEEYMEWRLYKTMRCYNAACFPSINELGNFQS